MHITQKTLLFYYLPGDCDARLLKNRMLSSANNTSGGSASTANPFNPSLLISNDNFNEKRAMFRDFFSGRVTKKKKKKKRKRL